LVVELISGSLRFTPTEKNVIVTTEFEVPKRHILRPTLSIDMVQRVLWWERQKRDSGRKKGKLMA
jgi:hypothetical protein